MGYYLRYLITDNQPVSLDTIRQALHSIDRAYAITENNRITYGGSPHGIIQINHPREDWSREELAEFREALTSEPDSTGKSSVEDILNRTTTIIAVQVLWQDRTAEQTLLRLDPLWDWLFKHYAGIQQADGEGYYNAYGPVLMLHQRG